MNISKVKYDKYNLIEEIFSYLGLFSLKVKARNVIFNEESTSFYTKILNTRD